MYTCFISENLSLTCVQHRDLEHNNATKTIGNRERDCAWSILVREALPKKICKLQSKNQSNVQDEWYSPGTPHTQYITLLLWVVIVTVFHNLMYIYDKFSDVEQTRVSFARRRWTYLLWLLSLPLHQSLLLCPWLHWQLRSLINTTMTHERKGMLGHTIIWGQNEDKCASNAHHPKQTRCRMDYRKKRGKWSCLIKATHQTVIVGDTSACSW